MNRLFPIMPNASAERMRTTLALLGLIALPGCVVVPVPVAYDGTAAGAGAALGALLGSVVDAALTPVPPPGAVWDPYAGVWRLP